MQNAAELDMMMRRLAYESNSYKLPVAIVLDIVATSPSLDHHYLWGAMCAAGIPSVAVS